MYCFNCGAVFPAVEVIHDYDRETGPMVCCPLCGVDDIGESEECSICGGDFAEGETEAGFCLSCLWEEITYDVALAYMKDHANWLAEFILEDWFDAKVDNCIGSSPALDAFLEETFRRLVADEKLRIAVSQAETPRFLAACREFCLPYYYNGDFCCEGSTFADWYAEYMRKEAAKK